ncbi:MAG: signal peptide peptidase SppA [Bergeyella sp.]|nr:signal peptide peptidase SppA [Bergeyella sp.]
MKIFLRSVLANIVAILLVFTLAFFLFIGLLTFGLKNGADTRPEITKKTILTLDPKTEIIESPAEGISSIIPTKKQILLWDILQAIRRAKFDENISGISIETDDLVADLTHITDIRAALKDFKSSGKLVYAYGNVVSQPTYYLGSVAEKYILNPAGGIELKGNSAEVNFYKNFFTKYGIGINVIRQGRYKAAVEPFLRNALSEENKAQISTLIQDLWVPMAKDISSSRSIDSSTLKTIVDSLYGIIPEHTLEHRLADQLLQKSQYDLLLKEKLGLETSEKLNKISFGRYMQSFLPNAAKDKVAILYASGNIMSGEGYEGIFSYDMVKEIKKIKEDKTIKAVVLRINSPGGSANAADEILFELSQLRQEKPLVVSFGDYAASGGYYIATAADKIYSEPNTITGSIGVFSVFPNFKALANKNGISSEIISTHANSQIYSPMEGLSVGAEERIKKSVERTYKRFVYFVSKNRGKTFEEIDKLARGKVWSGSRALKVGLVDSLGSLQDAVVHAAKKGKVANYEIATFPKKRSAVEQLFGNINQEHLTTQILKLKMGKEYRTIDMLIKSRKNVPNDLKMELPFSLNTR